MNVVKKDGTLEEYNEQKIINAVNKAARRAMIELSDEEYSEICNAVWDTLEESDFEDTDIYDMHNIVETVLEELQPKVAKMYKEYRNYKKDFVHMMDKVYEQSLTIRYIGDKDNANTDSSLVATKRSLIYNQLSREHYKKFFMTKAEKQAAKDGYIYVHDQSSRLDTFNCDLVKVGDIMHGGFEMGNIWYNEPKTLDTAFDVMGDIILSTAAQQYGGYTVPEVDKILSPYAEKSYWKYRREYADICDKIEKDNNIKIKNTTSAEEYAISKVERDFEQGWQGIEYKLNSVGSSRGDYPFITMTIGLATDKFGKMAAISLLDVHRKGQGKEGFKRPVLFPKIVFLYDKNLHGDGSESYPNADVFNAGIECSSQTMYPDWLSLTGEGYVSEMYKKYGRVVSPMGCVDGKEIVSYRYNGHLHVESFEHMWDRLSEHFDVKSQYVINNPNLYMDLQNVEIYDTEKGFVNCQRIIRNISNDWVDVHLSNGRRLLCTSDHPLHVLNKGTVMARELHQGDKLRVNSDQVYDEKILINKDRAWFLGFMLCDGCYQNGHVFASIAAEGEDEIQDKFTYVVNNHFRLPVDVVLQERGTKGTYKDLKIKSDGSTGMVKLCSYLTQKFEGINKVNRHIPNEVFEWDYVGKLAFMAGMIDADGYINPSTHGGSVVQIGSTNKELALQQMALAQALGMPARLYHNHYSKKNPNAIRYRVEFYPSEELLEYLVCQKKIDNFRDAIDSHYTIDAEVIEILPVNKEDYSYDVTTDSEHFEVSGIYSHNCRAFLSPWYERGGMEPADENDKPVFEGRFNLGVVSLNLPMILARARKENKEFYEVLNYYLELIRGLHQRTYDYLGELKASTNPVMFCEGGLYGGNLKPSDKIKSILPPMTMSFGITALNELQRLYNGKSIREDGQFALEVMQYINDYIGRIKKEDNILYAIYGTPAESLCFDGNTLVQTLDGSKPIKDITDNDLVYSFNEQSKEIELKPVISVQMTNKNAMVVKVTFDNNQEIICTPNHPFAVRKVVQNPLNGQFVKEEIQYINASDLIVGDRIKSNYIIINSDGHLKCTTDQYIHDINAKYFLGDKPKGYVVHHKDQNKLNNSFDNLEYMPDSDHRRLHIENNIKKYQYKSEDVIGENNPFYGKKHTKETINKISAAKMGANNPSSKKVIKASLNGIIEEIYESKGIAEKGNNITNLSYACNGKYKTKKNPHEYMGHLWYFDSDIANFAVANHTVKNVEYLNETIPVYNIEVADNHNFYVGGKNGILVHNCGLQVEQFRQLYGIIENVSDRTYVSNSFHCHVTEDMSPIEKQDKEGRFWNLFNGGKIQYCRYNLGYNIEAIKTLVLRAMEKGFYEGVNLAMCYCEDCGYQQVEIEGNCPKCGSPNIAKIDRMNGYLGWTRVHGDTRYNQAKNDEIADRVSM